MVHLARLNLGDDSSVEGYLQATDNLVRRLRDGYNLFSDWEHISPLDFTKQYRPFFTDAPTYVKTIDRQIEREVKQDKFQDRLSLPYYEAAFYIGANQILTTIEHGHQSEHQDPSAELSDLFDSILSGIHKYARSFSPSLLEREKEQVKSTISQLYENDALPKYPSLAYAELIFKVLDAQHQGLFTKTVNDALSTLQLETKLDRSAPEREAINRSR